MYGFSFFILRQRCFQGGIKFMTKQLKLYIDGEWVDSSNSEKKAIINPANQDIIAKAPKATKEETENTIHFAQQTFESGVWSEQTPSERASVLFQIADQMEKSIEALINLEVENNGKTKREAESDANESIKAFRYYASLLLN